MNRTNIRIDIFRVTNTIGIQGFKYVTRREGCVDLPDCRSRVGVEAGHPAGQSAHHHAGAIAHGARIYAPFARLYGILFIFLDCISFKFWLKY